MGGFPGGMPGIPPGGIPGCCCPPAIPESPLAIIIAPMGFPIANIAAPPAICIPPETSRITSLPLTLNLPIFLSLPDSRETRQSHQLRY